MYLTEQEIAEQQSSLRWQHQQAGDELRRLESALDQAGGLDEEAYERLLRQVRAQRNLVAEIGECLT